MYLTLTAANPQSESSRRWWRGWAPTCCWRPCSWCRSRRPPWPSDRARTAGSSSGSWRRHWGRPPDSRWGISPRSWRRRPSLSVSRSTLTTYAVAETDKSGLKEKVNPLLLIFGLQQFGLVTDNRAESVIHFIAVGGCRDKSWFHYLLLLYIDFFCRYIIIVSIYMIYFI